MPGLDLWRVTVLVEMVRCSGTTTKVATHTTVLLVYTTRREWLVVIWITGIEQVLPCQ